MIIGSVITIIMSTVSVKGEALRVRWNKSTFIPMILFGFGILLIGFIHSVGDGFVAFPIDLIFVFPFFYYVWISRGDHKTLYIMIASSILFLGIVSFMYCFLLAERGELIIIDGRMAGHMENVNFLGCIGAVLFMASLFLLSILYDRLSCVFICSAGLGIGIVYVALSGSRTSMLSQIASILVLIVFLAKAKARISISRKDIGIRMIVMTVAVVIVTYTGLKLDDINYSAVSSGIVFPNEIVYAGDEASAEEQAGEGAIPLFDRFDSSDGLQDLNSFGSGRIKIWKIYADNLSWFGQPFWQIEEQFSEAAETRAHNNFLEYFYRCGYIVGSLYVWFYVAIGIAALKRLFDRKCSDSMNMFLVMIVFTYLIYSLIEIAFLPFTRIVPCLFFLMIAPLMGEKHK